MQMGVFLFGTWQRNIYEVYEITHGVSLLMISTEAFQTIFCDHCTNTPLSHVIIAWCVYNVYLDTLGIIVFRFVNK